MRYGEIKAVVNLVKVYNGPKSYQQAQVHAANHLKYQYDIMMNVHRLFLYEEVKPQANGGRKIRRLVRILGCRNSQWAIVMIADGNPSFMELRP